MPYCTIDRPAKPFIIPVGYLLQQPSDGNVWCAASGAAWAERGSTCHTNEADRQSVICMQSICKDAYGWDKHLVMISPKATSDLSMIPFRQGALPMSDLCEGDKLCKTSAAEWEASHEVWNYCGSIQSDQSRKECFDRNGGHEPGWTTFPK
jgi:hypothetical protein